MYYKGSGFAAFLGLNGEKIRLAKDIFQKALSPKSEGVEMPPNNIPLDRPLCFRAGHRHACYWYHGKPDKGRSPISRPRSCDTRKRLGFRV